MALFILPLKRFTGSLVAFTGTLKRLQFRPATSWSDDVWFARLAFDPAVSSHFHVFEFALARVVDTDMQGDASSHTKAVRIYSSKSGAWTHPIVWDNPVSIACFAKGVFLNGTLYSSSSDDFVLAVGMEGNYRAIPVPAAPHSADDVHDVYLSQGQLHLANRGASRLSVWVLDSSGENWTLKHGVSHLQLLGTEYSTFARCYTVSAIHPEHNNVIFILCQKGHRSPAKLMSYDMVSMKLSFIRDVGSSCMTPYLSYVPLFSDSLADITT
jgi:hypothetical protein